MGGLQNETDSTRHNICRVAPNAVAVERAATSTSTTTKNFLEGLLKSQCYTGDRSPCE